jgi:hypothetical protein
LLVPHPNPHDATLYEGGTMAQHYVHLEDDSLIVADESRFTVRLDANQNLMQVVLDGEDLNPIRNVWGYGRVEYYGEHDPNFIVMWSVKSEAPLAV